MTTIGGSNYVMPIYFVKDMYRDKKRPDTEETRKTKIILSITFNILAILTMPLIHHFTQFQYITCQLTPISIFCLLFSIINAISIKSKEMKLYIRTSTIISIIIFVSNIIYILYQIS